MDAGRLMELRDEAYRQAGGARAEADRHRELASRATDITERQAHERGVQSYGQLAEQHLVAAGRHQTQLEHLKRDLDQTAALERAEQQRQAQSDQREQARLAEQARREEEARQADAEKQTIDNKRRLAELEAEIQRYRALRNRGRSRTSGQELER